MAHARDAHTPRLEELMPKWAEYRDTIRHNPRGTIVPERARTVRAEEPTRAFQLLQWLRQQDGPASAQRFQVVDTIAVGGMGLICEAEQVVLGRTVALKSLRPDQRTEDNVWSLLREAWVAGSLDHPNVASVHDITVDEDGSPLIVLEYIEGQAWSELMFDDKRVRERFGADDLLEWNLGVLMQVLNAIRYAHNRGIVHRDIKPDNVMIGEFGEVYVVDWGIAVALSDDGSGMLPLASEAEEMAGTPCYMAPEMLGGHAIDELTDIYLVGAVLYELLTGHPPHLGTEPREIITSVVRSEPRFPADVPEGLARICRRAMDPDPAGRFENAEQVRLAIQGFLRHRGSERLAVQARHALEELEAMLAAKPTTEAAVRRQELYRLYGACLFGFREALSTWPANHSAGQGLTRATTAMVEYELAHGDARAAEALCAAIDQPSESLRRRIEAAARVAEAEKQRIASLQEMAHQLDMSVGQGARFFTILVMGSLFTTVPLLFGWLISFDILSSLPTLMSWTGGCIALALAIGAVTREAIKASAINRRLYAMLLIVLSAQLLMEIGMWRAGFEAHPTVLMHEFMWFLTLAGVSVTIDRRLAPSAACYLATFFALAENPHWAMAAFTLPHLWLTVNALWVWRPGARLPA